MVLAALIVSIAWQVLDPEARAVLASGKIWFIVGGLGRGLSWICAT